MAAHGTGRLQFGEHQITSVPSAVRPETGAWAMPICASNSFGFGDAQYAADLLSLQTRIYVRIGHPTSAGFEERLDSQEGEVGAGASSLGQVAQQIGSLALCREGGQAVASQSLCQDRAVRAADPRFGVEETGGLLVSGWLR